VAYGAPYGGTGVPAVQPPPMAAAAWSAPEPAHDEGPTAPIGRDPRRSRRAYRVVKIIVTLVVIAGLLAVAGAAYWFFVVDKKDPTKPQGAAAIAQWVRKADVPLPLEGAAVAAYQGKLWVAGGQQASDPKTKTNEVFVYDPATDDWTVGPALPNQISHATLVPTPSGLYLVGGWLVDGGSTQVLRLDGAGKAWTPQPPLPESRVNGIGGYTGAELVYAGGTKPGPEPADTVWALRRDSWVEIGRLATPRQKAMAAGNGTDTLWIMGGRNIQTEEKFGTIDLVTTTVAKSDRVIEPPVDSGAGVYVPNSGICVVGGQTPNGGFNDWWCWEGGLAQKLPALNPQRGGLAAAVIDRTVYVVGGYGKGFSSLSRLDTLTLPPR
jgi:N-acetylneuraminic acid mutarotase